jgi:uncharacterized protein involved in exopolysaccharide biosynthesis
MKEDLKNFVFTPKPVGIRDIFNQLFREKLLCRNVFLSVVVLGSLLGLKMGTIYQSEASILLLPSREYLYSQQVGANMASLNMTSQEFVLSEAEMFKDRRLTKKTLEQLGIEKIYPKLGEKLKNLEIPGWKEWLIDNRSSWLGADASLEKQNTVSDMKAEILDRAVTSFMKSLKVFAVKDSNVITLSFKHEDPVIAAEALATLVSNYQDHRRQIYAQVRSGMFMAQRNRYESRLAAMETEIASFKLNNDISAFADQKTLLVRQKAELSASRIDAETKLREVLGRLDAMGKKISQLSPEILNYQENTVEDSASAARNSLISLEARRTELLTKFKPDSVYVRDLNEQVEAMRNLRDTSPPALTERRQVTRNPIRAELEMDSAKRTADAASLSKRLESLKAQEYQIDQQLHKFDRLESAFNSLSINRDILEENLKTYSQKVEEALIQEEMDRQKMDNVRVIEQPEAPRDGINMFKILVMLSVIIGGLLASAAALIRHYLRQSFLSPEDAERSLLLPVLIAIPLKTGTAVESRLDSASSPAPQSR